MLWAHMHDEQIKLKEENPKSRFAKESISPVLRQHARVVLRNGYWLVLTFKSRMSLVLPTMQIA